MGVNIRTSKRVIPMIYAYTTPEIRRHDGWTKIGYTEKDVDTRIKQQTHTADITYHEEWRGNAIFEDGSGDTFRDTDFHAYLRKRGVAQEPGKDNEWFQIDGPRSRSMFFEFRTTRGVIESGEAVSYTLRDEQNCAVSKACDYFRSNEGGEFLWNAKPRFGKTLSVYDLCKRMEAMNVLIVTNRPAIANSWYSDYCKFLGEDSGYRFISEVPAIANKPHTLSRETFDKLRLNGSSLRCIEFLSLQDLKGSIYFGGKFDKLGHVKDQRWDLLVIDEAHEGVDTYKTDVAFDHIRRRWTLHLSGTPFKALANSKFPENAIYNWTYSDEQKAKSNWESKDGSENPYGSLPCLSMLTYQMSKVVEDEVRKGIQIDGSDEEFAFDLNEFFSTDKNGRFVHEDAVDKFIDALTTQERFPFSTPELRNELRHTLWLLNRVDSARALARKLAAHPIFSDYEIVLAAGDGRVDDEIENTKAFDRVVAAIEKHEKTITISVGQLTTGVTIPEWTAVLMLSNMSSPSLYMQAAFRAQNPCLFKLGKGEFLRKETAYVFDFDPARTLIIYEKFANDLSSETTAGRGDSDTRKRQVRELLNFFPVLGEDEGGRMVELDAEQVLSIPRKIRSVEVVRRGFMSDFLFQNISNIFHAPVEILDLINSLEAVKEPKAKLAQVDEEMMIDEAGNVVIPHDIIVGEAGNLFGEKIYAVDSNEFGEMFKEIEECRTPSEQDKQIQRMMDVFKTSVTSPMIDTAKGHYGANLTQSAKKTLERKINTEAETAIRKAVTNLQIIKDTLAAEKTKELDASRSDQERMVIEENYARKEQIQLAEFKQTLNTTLDDLYSSAKEGIVERVITDQQQQRKKSVEDAVRDHLRGFSRTIPSFLMAYGDDAEIMLENFDTIVPADVFEQVTSITLDQFRLLRDGGTYINEETGEEEEFGGHLFDPVVFDDSVKEFMSLKRKLADYFDDESERDIFDYIPPQKTNQIFTPRSIVKEMVDMLEQENPGCFDDETKTFADLYMKSGLYLSEIIKRLYRSEHLKQLYPDEGERLNHIFSKQVYGLAPTEIIYRITMSFLLGFSDKIHIERHNIKQCDALIHAKAGTLSDELMRLFPERADLQGSSYVQSKGSTMPASE